MFWPPILSSSMETHVTMTPLLTLSPLGVMTNVEVTTMSPPCLDILLNPCPPDSLHQSPFTCTTSHCRIDNTSLDPAKGRPYLEALMYSVTPLNASVIKADEGLVLQSTWIIMGSP